LCTSKDVSPRRGHAGCRGTTPPMLCFALFAFSLPRSRQRSVLARLLPVFVNIGYLDQGAGGGTTGGSDPRMSEHILTHKHQTHKHQAHNHAASGWRIHCGVEVTELNTNKQHSLSLFNKTQSGPLEATSVIFKDWWTFTTPHTPLACRVLSTNPALPASSECWSVFLFPVK